MRLPLKSITLLGGVLLGASVAFAVRVGQDAVPDPQNDLALLQVQFRPNGSYLGIRLADIDPDRATALKLAEARGVEITEVEPGSPAAEAGLKTGDVLLTYNGENILGAQQLGRLVYETPPGHKIRVQYWREGRQETTVITTRAPRVQAFTNIVPPGDVGPWMSGERFPLIDVPNPIMVWKNSLLGIWCEPMDSQLAQYFGVKRGILVRSVEKDSPAEKAGVKAGDVLTSIGDRSVGSPHDLTSYMRSQREPAHSVTVELMRDHRPLTLHVVVREDQQ
ncbi:MAG: PDZ domain-containing protein [Acidobacteriaceae bacterium]|nr:PDZ domain-containing protein [Acidobacteriaceae bacterium]